MISKPQVCHVLVFSFATSITHSDTHININFGVNHPNKEQTNLQYDVNTENVGAYTHSNNVPVFIWTIILKRYLFQTHIHL